MTKILNIKDTPNGKIIEGLVPAKCIVGFYKVRIRVINSKMVESECNCGSTLCPHAVKLYLFYMAHVKRNENSIKR
ncbi:hypothetical protein [Acidianus sp. HS-5]|uniref:hypothetical protein n=1 Tax=Acidianus sp. HS-5 TaxID=2886040 RepID=UPI001F248712|nr:hypothetical protein [Acidianus sp. HS-5]BDC18447.1 hypothetical protein HS5_13370 [Acidianus sp. HS-5]